MLKHGGRFENYFSRRRVTHIICCNLPDSKIKNLRFISLFFFKLLRMCVCLFIIIILKIIVIAIVCNFNSGPLAVGSLW